MVTKTTYSNRASWLEARNARPVLGSSDVGTIMGLNPYCTPFQYWMQQKDTRALEEEKEALFRGQFKEDAIAKWFAHKTGEKIIQRSSEITVYRNDKFPDYVQVAPDRELFAKGREDRPGLECKDTKLHIPELDADNMPKMWYAQIQYQMGVMERSQWYIAAEEGGKNLIYALFDYSEKAFNHIYSYCSEWFERYILGDEVPPAETKEDAAIMWPVHNPGVKKAVNIGVYGCYESLYLKKQSAKKLAEEIKELEDRLAVQFEDAEAIEYEGRTLATYKTQKRRSFDTKGLETELPDIAAKYVKETEYKVLRLKKI